METTTCKTQREAHGAYCLDCEAIFSADRCPYWHWSKSKGLHESGSGHKMRYFKVVR